jgi:hypothetical protein
MVIYLPPSVFTSTRVPLAETNNYYMFFSGFQVFRSSNKLKCWTQNICWCVICRLGPRKFYFRYSPYKILKQNWQETDKNVSIQQMYYIYYFLCFNFPGASYRLIFNNILGRKKNLCNVFKRVKLKGITCAKSRIKNVVSDSEPWRSKQRVPRKCVSTNTISRRHNPKHHNVKTNGDATGVSLHGFPNYKFSLYVPVQD